MRPGHPPNLCDNSQVNRPPCTFYSTGPRQPGHPLHLCDNRQVFHRPCAPPHLCHNRQVCLRLPIPPFLTHQPDHPPTAIVPSPMAFVPDQPRLCHNHQEIHPAFVAHRSRQLSSKLVDVFLFLKSCGAKGRQRLAIALRPHCLMHEHHQRKSSAMSVVCFSVVKYFIKIGLYIGVVCYENIRNSESAKKPASGHTCSVHNVEFNYFLLRNKAPS